MIKFCQKCHDEHNELCPSGYSYWWKDAVMECPNCGCTMKNIDFPAKDLSIIMEISEDINFIEAMINLKQNDIIEYETKMSQFRSQVAQQQSVQNSNVPKCPKCGSTSITTGARGVNWMTGFIGASKTVNRCANCGYTWKPGR